MTRALVVANAGDADTGHVGQRLRERGWELRTVLREGPGVPAEVPADVDLVLLLGSEWSVATPAEPAALATECRLVRSAGEGGVPVLGLCYGAQVVAAAYGGRVTVAPHPEVGLVPVETVAPEVVPEGPWWAFHLDVIDPPPGAAVVARNACGVQAFTLPGVLGVQFHPEVLPATLEDWAGRFPDVLQQVGVAPEALVQQARDTEPLARATATALVDAFLTRVAPGAAGASAPGDRRVSGPRAAT